MKIKDAIDWIDIARMGYICDPNDCGLEKDGDTCRAFHCDEIHDALVMAMDAIEKQTPKKPKWGHHCPNCENWLQVPEILRAEYKELCIECCYPKYCPNCGQQIDWSDEK